MDRNPRLLFKVRCGGHGECPEDHAEIAALVAKHVQLSDAAGEAVPLAAEIDARKHVAGAPVTELSVAVTVNGSLGVDRWYTLRLSSDREVVMGTSDLLAEEVEELAWTAPYDQPGTATIAVPFFTGSAPHVTRLMHGADPRKPRSSMVVTFSEPVTLGSAARSLSIAGERGAALPGCVWSAALRRCADGDDRMVSSAVEYVFSKPVSDSDLASVEVRAAGSLAGAGRTLAEGARSAGITLDVREKQSPCARVRVAASDWRDCTGSGDSVCFHAPPSR
ncbi:Hypothetical protein A7982_04518 [Minicystis rosea]|nr:Hypothetical protein A7982_04518 [Minicystis rosea]